MKAVIQGKKDLASVNPKLASEWDYEKNGSLLPQMVSPGSHKKVWWKCKEGHEWQAFIYSRDGGYGCPYCAGRYAIIGENDLATVNPDIASEWNYEKNGDLKPESFLPSSNRKVWWKCKEGHEWQAQIANRTNGNGCPKCSTKRRIIVRQHNLLQERGNLLQNNPTLSSEWNYDKNGDLQPEQFTVNSGVKVWWKCKEGHEWKTSISCRNRGSGCPVCSKKITLEKNKRNI